jgi:hypothetical protein
MPPARQARSCVIVVENLPVPFDRRVWQEAQALRRAGWIVSVICPTNADFPKAFEVIDDIAIYRHPLPAEGRGALAYLREYSTALFHEFRLLFKVHRDEAFRSSRPAIRPTSSFLPRCHSSSLASASSMISTTSRQNCSSSNSVRRGFSIAR